MEDGGISETVDLSEGWLGFSIDGFDVTSIDCGS